MIVDGFGRSARNFQSAGYDGVEIHARMATCSPSSSPQLRTGGATRIEATRSRAEPVSCSRSSTRSASSAAWIFRSAFASAQTKRTHRWPRARRHARDRRPPSADTPATDYLITVGMRGAYVKDSSFEEGFALGLVEAVKQLADVPVIAAGRFRLPDLAERALVAGQADFIGVGRALVGRPRVGGQGAEWTRGSDPSLRWLRAGLPRIRRRGHVRGQRPRWP